MKQKLLNSIRLRVCMLVAILCGAVSSAWGDETTTYTFTSKSWAATSAGSNANWTSGKDGAGFSNNGIQVTTNATGANGTSPVSFTNVTKIVATYNTNKSKGAGSIVAQIGTNTATTNNVAYSGSADGTSANFTTEFTYSTPQSGNVKLTINTTTNSIYLVSVAITTSSGGSSNLTANDLTLNETSKSFDLADGANQTFLLTNSGSADGALSYESNNTAVATVTNAGLITAVGEGTATITVTQAASSTYEGGSATCEVTVTDSRYTVSDLTFTAQCGGSGTADDGAEWTVTSDGTESNFDNSCGIHYGTSSANVTYLQLATSDINGQIAKVVVNARDAQATAAITVTVGNTSFTCGGNTSVTATNTSTDYIFTGTGSGEIVVRVDRGSSMTKAIYVKSVKVSYIPDTTPTCQRPTFSPAAGTYTSAQNVTISAESGATIYFTTDGTDPTTSSSVYSSAISVSSTTTIKAIAVKQDYNNSPIATAEYNIVSLAHAGTQADPYTVADALIAIDANVGVTDVYVTGIVCTASSKLWSDKYLSYYISDDGEATSDKLEAYNGLGINGADFTSVDDIQVGDEVVIYGRLIKYNSTYELASDNQLVSLHRNVVQQDGIIGIADASVAYGTSYTIDTENDVLTDGELTITVTNPAIASVKGTTITPLAVGSTTISVSSAETAAYTAASDEFTLTVTAPEGKTTAATGGFVKVTSTADITDGQYLIVYEGEESSFAFDGSLETLDAESNTITVNISEGKIEASDKNKAAAFTIDVTNGTIKSASGKYIGKTANSNGLDTNESTAYTNTFSIDESGNAVITASGNCTLRYNSASGQERFRYYKSGQQPIQLYKLSEVNLTAKLSATTGYATYCSEYPLDFSDDSEFSAWEITNIEGTTITFNQIKGSVKGGTGVFLKGEKGATVTLTSTNSTTELGDNYLEGTLAPTYVEANKYYGLSGQNFVKINAGTVPAGKAILDADWIDTTGGVKAFTFVFDGADGIQTVESVSAKEAQAIFNLAGQRLQKVQRGVNIINGKKVLVK